jgi:hypothetical protein
MNNSAAFRLLIVAGLSCVTAACQSVTATSDTQGAGYSFVRFTDPKAARAASQDPTAGPAIANNNRQCAKDKSCRK